MKNMNKELRELLNKINKKKEEIRSLVENKDIEGAKAAKKELKELQEAFDLLADLEDDAKSQAEQSAEEQRAEGTLDKAKKQIKAFVNAMKAAYKKTQVSQEDAEILNAMSEGSDPDGGLIVPKDIRTKIKELRRGEDALETLVNVEPVTTNSGTRVIEQGADQTPFDNVEEAAEFPEVSTPQFENIEYKIKKKGGILKVTAELLEDTAENIIGYLKKWIAKKAKATRNFMIIAKIKEICGGLEVTVNSLDDLKDIFNVYLDPAIAAGASVVTNQYGFNFLDKLKDEKGNYILQKDPTQATRRLLFGVYPVKVVSNKTFPNINNCAPIVCGDFKEAITLFDRNTLTIDVTNLAAGAWEKDQTNIKVRERLDIQTVDSEAILMGLAPLGDSEPTEDINEDGTYNEKELSRMTKAQILELAEEKGYALEVTEENNKDEIIADFLAKQEAAQA